MITSAQNPKVKQARALLGRPKERRESGAFVAEGLRLVEEALAAGWSFQFVLHSQELSGRGSDLIQGLRSRDIETEEIASPLMDGLSDTGNSQGVLAVLDIFSLPNPPQPSFILIPDQVRDPGNLGTLLRTAAAAGVQAVFLPPETVDAFSPKVVRAGMGAHFRLPLVEMTWEEIRERTGALQVFLAEMGGASCWETDLSKPLALIIGGEAEGASKPAHALATATVSIPMPGQSESLNAAVAGAVLMFEVIRQRKGGA